MKLLVVCVLALCLTVLSQTPSLSSTFKEQCPNFVVSARLMTIIDPSYPEQIYASYANSTMEGVGITTEDVKDLVKSVLDAKVEPAVACEKVLQQTKKVAIYQISQQSKKSCPVLVEQVRKGFEHIKQLGEIKMVSDYVDTVAQSFRKQFGEDVFSFIKEKVLNTEVQLEAVCAEFEKKAIELVEKQFESKTATPQSDSEWIKSVLKHGPGVYASFVQRRDDEEAEEESDFVDGYACGTRSECWSPWKKFSSQEVAACRKACAARKRQQQDDEESDQRRAFITRNVVRRPRGLLLSDILEISPCRICLDRCNNRIRILSDLLEIPRRSCYDFCKQQKKCF